MDDREHATDELESAEPSAAPGPPSWTEIKVRPGPVIAVVVAVILAFVAVRGCDGSGSSPVRHFIEYPGNGRGPTQCEDGSWSHSAGQGTCSWHGGVDD